MLSFLSRPLRPPRLTLFPYTTLFRSVPRGLDHELLRPRVRDERQRVAVAVRVTGRVARLHAGVDVERQDRKSTRLNSSHLGISYAVFCSKTKKSRYAHILCSAHNCFE